jgi:hypothetical protein
VFCGCYQLVFGCWAVQGTVCLHRRWGKRGCQLGDESWSTEISEISVIVKEKIAEKKRVALENLKRSLDKRKATEDQMVIEREKKGRQRMETFAPELKKQRMSEETNVIIQEGLSKRQKAEGQNGCAQLVCSTHKGIS